MGGLGCIWGTTLTLRCCGWAIMPPDVTLGGGGTAFVLARLDSRELVEAACLKDDELDDELMTS